MVTLTLFAPASRWSSATSLDRLACYGDTDSLRASWTATSVVGTAPCREVLQPGVTAAASAAATHAAHSTRESSGVPAVEKMQAKL